MINFIFKHVFGLSGKPTIPLPVGIWWALWKAHGYRNWRRGYRDGDVHTLIAKLCTYPKPGEIIWLTRRERNVFHAWYGYGQVAPQQPGVTPKFLRTPMKPAAKVVSLRGIRRA